METEPHDNEETILGDADEVDTSIEEQLDDKLEQEILSRRRRRCLWRGREFAITCRALRRICEACSKGRENRKCQATNMPSVHAEHRISPAAGESVRALFH